MSRTALRDAATPLVLALARLSVSRVARRAHQDGNALAAAAFVRSLVRYINERPETISTWNALLRLRAGDCDDMSVALVALLLRLGYPPQHIKWAIGWRGPTPDHVWLSVYSPRLRRAIDLDPSTFEVALGSSPAARGRFTRVTLHPLEF